MLLLRNWPFIKRGFFLIKKKYKKREEEEKEENNKKVYFLQKEQRGRNEGWWCKGVGVGGKDLVQEK